MRRSLVPLVLLFGLLTATPASAASITFETTDRGNGLFGVDIRFSTEGVLDLAGFDFLVGFDPASATLQSVSEGSFLSDLGATFFFFVPAGTDENGNPIPVSDESPLQLVNLLFGSTTGAVGTGVLATLVFETAFNPTLVITPQLFIDSTGAPIDVQFVPPQPVPEPSTLALLGIGLAAMARKKLKRRTPGN